MTTFMDTRPPGLDVVFRPSNSFDLVLGWPAGFLAGKTFVATLDVATLTISILADTMTITASEAQTSAATGPGVFKLTETTGGMDQVLMTGRWRSSVTAAARTSVAATITFVDTAITIGGATDAVRIAGDQAITGVKTFATSPKVPNPTAPVDNLAAISYGEVVDLIAATPVLSGSSTLFVGSFGTIPTFGQKVVGNTVTETSLLNSTPTVPAMGVNSTAQFIISGDLKNSSGGAVTLTLRFKIAGTTVLTIAPSIPNDANTRPYRLCVDLQNLGSSFANMVGEHVVHPGATAPYLATIAQAVIVNQGASAAAWDVTAQWSAAASTITMQRLLANLRYGIGV